MTQCCSSEKIFQSEVKLKFQKFKRGIWQIWWERVKPTLHHFVDITKRWNAMHMPFSQHYTPSKVTVPQKPFLEVALALTLSMSYFMFLDCQVSTAGNCYYGMPSHTNTLIPLPSFGSFGANLSHIELDVGTDNWHCRAVPAPQSLQGLFYACT